MIALHHTAQNRIWKVSIYNFLQPYRSVYCSKILGNTTDGFHELYKHEKQTYIYRPELTELVRRFHSLVVIGFSIPEELVDYASNRD